MCYRVSDLQYVRIKIVLLILCSSSTAFHCIFLFVYVFLDVFIGFFKKKDLNLETIKLFREQLRVRMTLTFDYFDTTSWAGWFEI